MLTREDGAAWRKYEEADSLVLLSKTVISPVQVEPDRRLLGPAVDLAQGSLDLFIYVFRTQIAEQSGLAVWANPKPLQVNTDS